METKTDLTPSWKYEDYSEYLHLKEEESKRLKKAKADFNKFPLKVKEHLLQNVPETKREDVLSNAKMELINKEMVKAQELLVKINSPFKDEEISSLKVNYDNLNRQLIYERTRLKLVEKGQEFFKSEEGKRVYKYQMLFVIEKLERELDLMRREFSLYDVTVQE